MRSTTTTMQFRWVVPSSLGVTDAVDQATRGCAASARQCAGGEPGLPKCTHQLLFMHCPFNSLHPFLASCTFIYNWVSYYSSFLLLYDRADFGDTSV